MTVHGATPRTPEAKAMQQRITTKLARKYKKFGNFLYGHEAMSNNIRTRRVSGDGARRVVVQPADDMSALTDAIDNVLLVNEVFDVDANNEVVVYQRPSRDDDEVIHVYECPQHVGKKHAHESQ